MWLLSSRAAYVNIEDKKKMQAEMRIFERLYHLSICEHFFWQWNLKPITWLIGWELVGIHIFSVVT